MAAMIVDSGARHLFLDAPAAAHIEGQAVTAGARIAMDGSDAGAPLSDWMRSEEHPSELQPLMRLSYAVFSLRHQPHRRPSHSTTLSRSSPSVLRSPRHHSTLTPSH